MGLPTMSLRAEDDGVGAFDFDFIAGEEFSMQPAGVQATRPGRQLTRRPRLTGWKPSPSLAGSTASRIAIGIDLRRERKLDEDAVDIVVAIQVFQDGEQIEGGNGVRRRE